jgi:hypothetical protein
MKIKLPFVIINRKQYETLKADHFFYESYRDAYTELISGFKDLKEQLKVSQQLERIARYELTELKTKEAKRNGTTNE